jgi:hypothetical protein
MESLSKVASFYSFGYFKQLAFLTKKMDIIAFICTRYFIEIASISFEKHQHVYFLLLRAITYNAPRMINQSWADVDLIANKDALLEKLSLITAVEIKIFIEPWEHQAISNEAIADEKCFEFAFLMLKKVGILMKT